MNLLTKAATTGCKLGRKLSSINKLEKIGEAAAKTTKSIKKLPHKNSLSYVGDTHVYAIKGPQGVYKIGESAQGLRKLDGASRRAEQQARRFARETDQKFKTNIIKTFGTKCEARKYETKLIETFRRLYGENSLPRNLTNR